MAKQKNGNGDGDNLPAKKKKKKEFLALTQVDTLKELVEMNIGGGTVSAFDLDRIQIPTGGLTVWTVPTLEGEDHPKTLDGIIIHMADPRSYWAQGFDESGGGTPPDCQSEDGVSGYGSRSEGEPEGHHSCATCPLAQFGSDHRGRGQACKAQKAIFMLREDTLLPICLVLPPTSLGFAKKYFMRLLSHNVMASGVITRWELQKVQNPDGINYSRAEPSSVRPLNKSEREKVKAYTATILPYLEGKRQEVEALPIPATEEEPEETVEEVEEE